LVVTHKEVKIWKDPVNDDWKRNHIAKPVNIQHKEEEYLRKINKERNEGLLNNSDILCVFLS
jgi:hypothetical protein